MPHATARVTALAAALVAAAVVLSAPWALTDRDSYARLAVGRLIATTGQVPATDPFTFTRPHEPWSNPEWLGDLGWFAAERAGGERAVVALALGLAALGWALALLVTVRRGAHPPLAAALLLLALPAAATALTARNALHAHWLIPLVLLLLPGAGRSLGRLAGLAVIGVLWAQLHSSFVVGWLLLGAACVDQGWGDPRDRPAAWRLAGLLAASPLLALIGPQGARVYAQLLEHLTGAPIYRRVILEWRPPAEVAAGLRLLPLHLLGLLALLSFLPRANRRGVGALLRVGCGLALAHGSQRFVALLGVLVVPDLAGNLQRALTARWPAAAARAVRRAALALAALTAAVLVPTGWQSRRAPLPPVGERIDTPRAAAGFLAAHAPAGARLFNPYNAGAYLLWAVGPRVQLYLDPRNNLGAPLLAHYLDTLLPVPSAFDAEARHLSFDLALLELGDGRFDALGAHLRRHRDWRPVFFDGRFALYARSAGRAAALARDEALRGVAAALDFDELLHPRAALPDAGTRARLRREAPAFARALEGFLLLRDHGGPPPLLRGAPFDREATRHAQTLLAGALPRLPASPALLSYLATAHARLGEEGALRELLEVATALFANDLHVLALRFELARRAQRWVEARSLLARIAELGYQGHPLWGWLHGAPAAASSRAERE